MDALHTPGDILAEEWLAPMGITQYALAKAIDVPARRISEIVQGKRAVAADTAVRLGAFFGVDPQSWMNLQTHYDTEQAREKLGDRLMQIRRNGEANEAITSLRQAAK
jgi:addiction module HigA family antidote